MKFEDSAGLLAAINGLETAIMIVDSNLELRLTNTAFDNMWEIGRNDLQPGDSFTNWLDLCRTRGLVEISDEDWEGFAEAEENSILGGTLAPTEIIRTDGRHLIHTATPIADEYRLISFFDISSQKKSQESLLAARQDTSVMRNRMTQAIESLEDGFVIFDHEDRLVICNDAFRNQFGDAARFLEPGKTYREMTTEIALSGIIPGIEGKEESFVEDLIAKRTSELGLEKVFQAHDGRWIKQRDKKTDNGDIVGVRIDVTTIKEQQAELQAAKQELEVAFAEIESSREKFKAFAESNADWFWEMGPDLRFSYFSDGFVAASGISPEKLIGKTRGENPLPGNDQDALARHLDDLENRKSFRDFVYARENDNGGTEWFSISGNPVWSTQGEFEGYLGSGRNVTEQIERQIELDRVSHEIERQKELLDLIMSASDNGILVTRGLDEVVTCNKRALEFFDMPEAEIIGSRDLDELIDKQYDLNRFKSIGELGLSREAFRESTLALAQEAKTDFKTLHLIDGTVWRYRVRALEDGMLLHSYVNITVEKTKEREVLESQALLHSLLETSENACLVTDADYNVVEYNAYFFDILACSEEDAASCLTLDDIFEVIYHNRQLKPFHKIEVTLESFLATAYEIREKAKKEAFTLHLADGRYLRYRLRQLENGHHVHSFVDISTEKLREAELESARARAESAMRENRKNEELFKAFAETNADWFWKMDQDLRFSYFSESFESVTSVNPSLLLGKTRRETGVPGVTEEVFEQHVSTLESHLAFRDFIHSRTSKDGKTVWLSISGNPVHSIDGEFEGYVGTGRDVTEQIVRQKRLEQAILAAEAAERAKSEFLANMSHEIRTPMNGVMGMAELLAGTELDTKQKMFTDVIVKSGASLLTIINDILDFSKIDAGQMELVNAPFGLAEAIEDIATLVSAKVAEKDLELIVRVNPSLPARVIGDVGRLRQVITNLLGNAVKFTEKGHIYVNVDGEQTDDSKVRLRFSVEDTGIGIPGDKCDQVFSKFSQVDNSATRKHEGTGLGLSIASSLVDLMGGEIKVESEVGKGSTFWFEITLATEENANSEVLVVPGDLSGARVLVIDDNEVNRSILSEQLAAWHFDSAAAASGDEAFRVIEAARSADLVIDLIILDYQMPEMCGPEVLRVLRANPATRNIPAIMLSSVDSAQSRVELQELGIEASLTKPTRSSLLLETMLQVISRKRAKLSGTPSEQGDTSQDLAVDVPPLVPADAPAPSIKSSTESEKPDPAEFAQHTIETETVHLANSDRVDLLIAEDNEVNQIVFTQIMDGTDIDYMIVENGQFALEQFKARRPRMVLMDVSMPELNGQEATLAIREYEAQMGFERTPVIGVTAHALKGDMEACLKSGMDDYLSKPVTPEKLVQKIEQWLAEKSGIAKTA